MYLSDHGDNVGARGDLGFSPPPGVSVDLQ